MDIKIEKFLELLKKMSTQEQLLCIHFIDKIDVFENVSCKKDILKLSTETIINNYIIDLDFNFKGNKFSQQITIDEMDCVQNDKFLKFLEDVNNYLYNNKEDIYLEKLNGIEQVYNMYMEIFS